MNRRLAPALAVLAAGTLLAACAKGTSDDTSQDSSYDPNAKLSGNLTVLGFGNSVLIHNPHVVLTHSVLVRGASSGPQTGTLIRNLGPTADQPELIIGTDLLKLLHLYIAFNERMVYVTQGSELPEGDARAMPVAVTVTPFRP